MKDGAITVHVRLDAKTFRRFSRFGVSTSKAIKRAISSPSLLF